MIEYRLKTAEKVDQIIVLDQGRIVQQGKHAELLEQDRIYRRFIQKRKRASSWKITVRHRESNP